MIISKHYSITNSNKHEEIYIRTLIVIVELLRMLEVPAQ